MKWVKRKKIYWRGVGGDDNQPTDSEKIFFLEVGPRGWPWWPWWPRTKSHPGRRVESLGRCRGWPIRPARTARTTPSHAWLDPSAPTWVVEPDLCRQVRLPMNGVATRAPRGRGRCPMARARSRVAEDCTRTSRGRAIAKMVLSRRGRLVSRISAKKGKSATCEPSTARRSAWSRPACGLRSACTSLPRGPRARHWKWAG